MDRAFLTELGLEEQAVQAVLEAAETERAGLQREFAIERAASQVRFSSKAAERDFIAQLHEKQLEVADGQLVGFEQFLSERKAAEPDAFGSDAPVPRFVAPVGSGGNVGDPVPANVAQAREIGAERAAAVRSSGEIMKFFL